MIKTILLYTFLVILYVHGSKEDNESNEGTGSRNKLSPIKNDTENVQLTDSLLKDNEEDKEELGGAIQQQEGEANELCVFNSKTSEEEVPCIICMDEFSMDNPRFAILLNKYENTLKNRLGHLKHANWWHKDCMNDAVNTKHICPYCRGGLSYVIPNQQNFKTIFGEAESNPDLYNAENLEKIEPQIELTFYDPFFRFIKQCATYVVDGSILFLWSGMWISLPLVPGWMRVDYGFISAMMFFILSNMQKKFMIPGTVVLFIINMVMLSRQEQFWTFMSPHRGCQLSRDTHWGYVPNIHRSACASLYGGGGGVYFNFFWNQVPKTFDPVEIWRIWNSAMNATVSIDMNYPIIFSVIQTIVKAHRVFGSLTNIQCSDETKECFYKLGRIYRRITILPALCCQILPAFAPTVLFYPLFWLSFLMWNPEEIWFLFGANIMAAYRTSPNTDDLSFITFVFIVIAKIIITLVLHFKYGKSIPMLK